MRFVKFLTSRGFAVFLLVVSVGYLFLWATYGFYSPFLLIIPAFLFLSILLCIVRRVLARDVKWDVEFSGSFIFHIGLLAIIAATVLGSLVRFMAIVVLPQGMTVDMDNEVFTSIRNIPAGKEPPFISIKSGGYKVTYSDDGFPIDYTTHITVLLMEKGVYRQREEDIRINVPLRWSGYQFMLEGGVFAPLFILKDKDGNVVFSQFLRLSNLTITEDTFEIPEAGLTVYSRFFPDVFKEGNKYGSRSKNPDNPAFGIRVVTEKDPFKDVWKGVMKSGDKAEFSGMTLELADLKPVVTIEIIKDPTYWGIMAGWLLIVAGLLIRYLPCVFSRKEKGAVEHGIS